MPLLAATDGGRLSVPVGWDDADALRLHFRRHGITATVVLDAEARAARLEVTSGSADQVREALTAWRPARA